MSDVTTTEQVAFSIRQFCKRHFISLPTYFKQRDLGRGPRELRFGATVRITLDAERDWQRARENPAAEEAAAVARQAEAMRDRARGAAKKAIASSKHISARRRAGTAA